MAGGRLSHNEDLPVLVSAEQAPVTGAVAAERKLAHPVVHASTAGVMLEWTVVGGYSGVALPGPVVLPVCYSALTMFVRSEALHHRNSVVPGVLAAHVVEGRCAVPGGAHVVSAPRYRDVAVPELNIVQGVRSVQVYVDGVASPLSGYHSGVPCLPAFRCPALENSADIIPSSFVL